MDALQARFFGSPELTLAGGQAADLRSAKARALLAYLTVEAGQAHRREKLVDLLWPEYSESSARANLRRALADLRQAIGDHQAVQPYLHISWEALQFNTESDAWVDVIAFHRHLDNSNLSGPNQPPVDLDPLEQAVALYRGPFLEGFSIPDSAAFEGWALLARERFQRQVLQTLNCLGEAYKGAGEYERGLPHAWRQVEMEPWQEGGHRQVMELLALAGQRGAALAQYETCRQLLEVELGAMPSGQTQHLYDIIRQGEWPSASPEAPVRGFRQTGACPYRGLAAFQEQDASLFFGREAFTTRLAEAVCSPQNVTVVVGSSGSGKSSVVFAGLLPRLREQKGWLIASFRPGGQPFESLAAALSALAEPDLSGVDRLVEVPKLAAALQAQDGFFSRVIEKFVGEQAGIARVLLVIDQFEELYTLCTDRAMLGRFLDMLLVAEPRLKLLLTLRADFFGQALSYRTFADLLQDGALMLGPMTRQELQAAIEKPAGKQGAAFEPGLVDRILDDVGTEPGSLPLLAFALLLLWERQRTGWLAHEDYDAIEQVGGALTYYADQVYEDLNQADRSKIERIMLQLIRPGEGTEDTRRVATRAEIGESHWPLTQLLADRRLVVTGRAAGSGDETAEVAHEALIQKWARLRGWMEAARSFRTWQEGLRAALRQWFSSGNDDDALLRGAPLGQAEGWYAERGSELSQAEVDYIRASVELRESRMADREAQRQRELAAERKARRLYGALAGVLLLAVGVALALTVFSLQQRRQALLAYSLSMAANARNALDDRDTSTGLALALAANQIADPPQEARRTLLDAAYSPGPRWRGDVPVLFPGVQGPVTALAASPDGRTILSGFEDGTLIYWEVPGKTEIYRLSGHSSQVNAVAFSPDGLLALSGGDDREVILWDLSKGEAIRNFSAHSGKVRAVGFSPDGSLALSGGFAGDAMLAPGELIVWNLATGEEVRRFAGHLSGITAAAFTPDGRAVLAGSGDAALFSDQLSGESLALGTAPFDLILWDLASGDASWRFAGDQDDVFGLVISPDGTRALVGSFYQNQAVLWDLASGQRLLTLKGHTEGVLTVAFSADGQHALTGSADDSLILWDLVTGQPVVVFKAHGDDVLGLAASPDGRTVLSSGRAGDLILWDLLDAAQVAQFAGHGDMVYDVAFTPDGKQALSVSGSSAPSAPVKDASLRLWDLETGGQIHSQEIIANVIFQVALSPDGQTALLATDQPAIIIWDLVSWREAGRLEGHPAAVTAVEFTPDGERALSLGVDSSLILWDVPRRRAIQSVEIPGEGLWSLAISPDGQTALTDTGIGSMLMWDLETGEQVRGFERPDQPAERGASGMAFYPDGRRAISCEQDGAIIEWNLETGKEIRRLGLHPSLRTRVVIHPDGSLALTSGMDGSLMLWDLETGELIRQTGERGVIFDLAVSPDGLTALYGSSDTMVYQWRLGVPTGGELQAWIQANRYVADTDPVR